MPGPALFPIVPQHHPALNVVPDRHVLLVSPCVPHQRKHTLSLGTTWLCPILSSRVPLCSYFISSYLVLSYPVVFISSYLVLSRPILSSCVHLLSGRSGHSIGVGSDRSAPTGPLYRALIASRFASLHELKRVHLVHSDARCVNGFWREWL